jgi:DNA repair protein RadD
VNLFANKERKTLTLRPYQAAAIEGLYKWFETEKGNPLVVLPTATGKSLCIADFCMGALREWPTTKIVILTHVRELIQQNFQELVDLWPDAPAGINSAAMGRRETRAPIVFAGIQSVHKSATKFGAVDIILIDECHLIPRDSDTMYRRFLNDLLVINPHMKIVGLTATPYRLDSGRLDHGEGKLFDGIAYDYPILDAVRQGYLTPLISKEPDTLLDVGDVGTRGGEFIASELQKAVDTLDINEPVVNEIIKWGEERKSWLIFGSGVEHCQHLAELVRAKGYSCDTIFGETPKTERDRIIRAFKAGEIRALSSMGVLTTGFNATAVDLIAMCRPTKSTGLYVQIAGRGMRLHPNKPNCLVLDFAGNVARHGPVDAVDPKDPKKGDGEMPTKTCPQCKSIVPAAALRCPDCDFEFPPRVLKIEARATVLPVMSSTTSKWIPVNDTRYNRHEKPGKPVSLCVSYFAAYTTYREWVCFEHVGFARQKAAGWWMRRGKLPVPATVAEALERIRGGELKTTTDISIKPAGKYTEVTDAKLALPGVPSGTEGIPTGPESSWEKPAEESVVQPEASQPPAIENVSWEYGSDRFDLE